MISPKCVIVNYDDSHNDPMLIVRQVQTNGRIWSRNTHTVVLDASRFRDVFLYCESVDKWVIVPRRLVEWCNDNDVALGVNAYGKVAAAFTARYYGYKAPTFETMVAIRDAVTDNPDMFPDPDFFPKTGDLLRALYRVNNVTIH